MPPSRRRWQVVQVAAGRRARPYGSRVEWPTAEPIETARLTLEPLRVHHAGEMADVLADPRLYEYVGGTPASVAKLEPRYALQAVGHSPDGHQGWLNWIVRERDTGAVVGTVQATLTDVGGRLAAEIAWVIGSAYQRRGYATEAAGAMVEWLRGHATHTIVAHIHPDHEASIGRRPAAWPDRHRYPRGWRDALGGGRGVRPGTSCAVRSVRETMCIDRVPSR